MEEFFFFLATTVAAGAKVIVVIIVGFFILAALKIIFSGSRLRNGSDEARQVQELHQGLERLESRLDALETILLEDKEARRP